jgi:hypothetical protein
LRQFEYQTWGGPGPEIPLSRSPYQMLATMPATYGFYFGAKFGRKPGMWLIDYAGDEKSRRLDSMTMEENIMAEQGLSRETVREFLQRKAQVDLAWGLMCSPPLRTLGGPSFIPRTIRRKPVGTCSQAATPASPASL